MKDNKYQIVEGLLYIYPVLQNRIDNADIDLKLEKDESKIEKIKEEKERLQLTKKKVELMLNSLSISEREIINLKYIERLDWQQVEARLNRLSVRQLIRERNKIITEKLVFFIN